MLTGPDLDAAVERAELRAAGRLGYEVHLDGRRVGDVVSVSTSATFVDLGIDGRLRGFTFRGSQNFYLDVREAMRGLIGTLP